MQQVLQQYLPRTEQQTRNTSNDNYENQSEARVQQDHLTGEYTAQITQMDTNENQIETRVQQDHLPEEYTAQDTQMDTDENISQEEDDFLQTNDEYFPNLETLMPERRSTSMEVIEQR
jgi:hypothetical protein